MPFFSFKEKEELSLLIDVGNGTLTVALTLFSKNKQPKFLNSIKMPFVIGEKPDADRLLENMYSLLDSGLSKLLKDGTPKDPSDGKVYRISRAMVAYSSPWFILKTKHLSLSQDVPFFITKSFLDDIASKEEKIFKEELNKNDPEMKGSFEVIEKSIVHTKINGYNLDYSIGKKTKTLDAFLCLSVVTKSIIEKTMDTIMKYTHIGRDKVLMHTFPLVSFSVIRDILGNDSDFVIFDVTSEVTDVTLVQNSVVTQTASIPSGRNFIIRAIVREFNVSFEIAESMLSMSKNAKMDEKTGDKMQEIIANTEKEWNIYLENALSELSSDISLPANVYMTADEDIADIYFSFLKMPKMDRTEVWRKNIKIVHVNGDFLKNLYEVAPTVKVDEFIALSAVFFEKIWNK